MKEWNLEEGIGVVRTLQPEIRAFGYHVALGGGVINKGVSAKDLDLYFLPMGGFKDSKSVSSPEKLLEFLTSFWGEHKKIGKADYEDADKDPQMDWGQIPDAAQLPRWNIQMENGMLRAIPNPVRFDRAVAAVDIERSKEAKPHAIYRYAVTFLRNKIERIDCFIF